MEYNEAFVNTLEEAFGIIRHQMMGKVFVYVRDKGLTMAQFGALMQIFHNRICAVSDIGSELGVTNSAASQLLERLVQLNLVTRTEDPSDRRAKQIVLTDKGRLLLQEISQMNRNWLEQLALSMSVQEQDQVRNALFIFVEKAQNFEAARN